MQSQVPWQPVLDFWFFPPGHPHYLGVRPEWFEKNPEFDQEVRVRFGTLIRAALAGQLDDWAGSAEGELARILLLDQFPRNAWRGTAEAFRGDSLALGYAWAMIEGGRDALLVPVQRKFVYLPLMHAEDLDIQNRCVELFEALAGIDPGEQKSLQYAIAHRDIIQRFGRFPHRNSVLGRASTDDEIEFLRTPGSSF